MAKRLTKEEFIIKANAIHNNRYDYSKIEYINSGIKICIICPKHGEFWQTPHQHIGKLRQGCPKCGLEKSLKMANGARNIDANNKARIKFFEKAKKIHGDRYDYSKVEYKNNYTKVCIICPIHGEFWQTPTSHIWLGQGCPDCNGSEAMRLKAKNEFIEKAKKIHGDRYDYSKVEYVNNITKVCIICPEHGEFWQSMHSHLASGSGCPKCGYEQSINGSKEHAELSRLNAKNEFSIKASKIHNNKYDYSKVDYVDAYAKVCIICPIHGEFWQTAHDHLRNCGCPYCSESRGERLISKWLDDHNVEYEREKTFEGLIGINGGNLRFDFYLPKYNICIEYDGIQHHEFVKGIMTEEDFKKLKKHDKIKNEFCKKNNIILARISSKNLKNFELIKI